jgi:hypothetical protein
MRMIPLLAGMLLAALTTTANAAEIKVKHMLVYWVSITGKIERGDFERFYEATKNLPSAGNVFVELQSNGGDLLAGLAIGSRIHEKGWTTSVYPPYKCASVCALIWLAGSNRSAPERGGSIGFHAAYRTSDGRESGAANALVGAYLKELGFGWETIFYLTKTAPNEMEWLGRAKAKK